MTNPYIILLRGVMPVGKNKLPMGRLREVVAQAGYSGVRTWIQSGNLLVHSSSGKAETAEHIHRLIKEQIGPDLAVIIRSPTEVQKALDDNPFQEGYSPERVFYTFPQSPMAQEAIERLAAETLKPEELRPGPDCLYLHIPGSAARTKLSNNFLEKVGKVACTTRNKNTLSKLVSLSREQES